MNLTRDDVEKVALLARLEFSDEELEKMTAQLGEIVTYIDLLQQLNTEGVEPLAHGVEVLNVFADDVVEPSLSRDDALSNAPKPDRDNVYYLVPAVLGSNTSSPRVDA